MTEQQPKVEQSEAAGTHKLDVLLANLLRGGVISSTCVTAIGVALMLVKAPAGQSVLPITVDFPHTPGKVLEGVMQLDPAAVVMLGLLMLLLTPVLRVIASIGGFAVQGDKTYAIITTIVLVVLAIAFALGRTTH